MRRQHRALPLGAPPTSAEETRRRGATAPVVQARHAEFHRGHGSLPCASSHGRVSLTLFKVLSPSLTVRSLSVPCHCALDGFTTLFGLQSQTTRLAERQPASTPSRRLRDCRLSDAPFKVNFGPRKGTRTTGVSRLHRRPLGRRQPELFPLRSPL